MLEVLAGNEVATVEKSAIGALVMVRYGQRDGLGGLIGKGRVIAQKEHWGRTWLHVEPIEGLPFDRWYAADEIVEFVWEAEQVAALDGEVTIIDEQPAERPFLPFGKTFWPDLAKLAGLNEAIHQKNLFMAVGKTSGVTPFRAFRWVGGFIVIVEPTYLDGAFVHVFENRDEFDAWHKKHMDIDITRRDM